MSGTAGQRDVRCRDGDEAVSTLQSEDDGAQSWAHWGGQPAGSQLSGKLSGDEKTSTEKSFAKPKVRAVLIFALIPNTTWKSLSLPKLPLVITLTDDINYFLFNSGYQTDLPHLYNSVDNNRHNGHSHTIRFLQCNKVSSFFVFTETTLSLYF